MTYFRPKGPKLHLSNGSWGTICGKEVEGCWTTSNEDHVTCKACLKSARARLIRRFRFGLR